MKTLNERLSEIKVVPVIAIKDASKAAKLAQVLVENGLPCAEVTFRTAQAAQAIKEMRKAFPDMLIGSGTVLTTAQVDESIEAGVDFIVSPGFNPTTVKYCQQRNITIVPEIDVPGHSMALLAAYPQLSTKKEYKMVNPGAKFVDWYDDGTFKMLIENTLNPADEGVYAFLDMIFGEIADLFPGEYIHMGGDECYHGYWEQDEKVQAFMAKNGINDGNELQSYFVKRVEKIISSKGKKMIGWDEILEGGLAEGAVVMNWRGMKGEIEAAALGHEVVMTPKQFVYLDYTQGDYSVENKIYADLSLKTTYSFEPVPDFILDPELILGGQGNLWTEEIPNLPFAFYMTYPRAMAISESLWSPKENKNWENFLSRTEVHFKRFDAQGVSVAKTIYEPEIRVYMEGRKLMCELKNPFTDIEMYYTIDNTYPIELGKIYTEPFEIPAGDLSLRAQSFRDGQAIERLLQIHRTDLEKRLK